ncbi:MAG: stage 0 sporulation family protein [Firmicutes bacterium]|nr:stage 0 sporulation family protein [Bacillota bacterium]
MNKVKVIGVRFKTAGKVYFFDPDNFELNIGNSVIVETARGMEFGTVTMEATEVSEDEIVAPLKKIIRIANEEDHKQHIENVKKKERAMQLCQEKVDKHGLVMKLIDVEYTFDNSKIIFYFTADGRVDFRELVKDLASVFKMRIELRQIGVRDEAKMMGGIGSCGRALCCHSWLADFEPVSIKMAKVQNLSLNPAKISGICGRLMCCLKYENDIYMELRRGMPEPGEKIKTPDGLAKVVDTNILENKIRARLFIDEKPAKGKKDEENGHDEHEEKLSPDIYTYKKEDIRRIEKRRDNSNKNLFEGVDAATMKEIEELIKD